MTIQDEINAISSEIQAKIDALSSECIELYSTGSTYGMWSDEDAEQKWHANNQEITRLKGERVERIAPLAKMRYQANAETEYAKNLREEVAIKEANVTSATHERWKKRMTRAADGFISHA